MTSDTDEAPAGAAKPRRRWLGWVFALPLGFLGVIFAVTPMVGPPDTTANHVGEIVIGLVLMLGAALIVFGREVSAKLPTIDKQIPHLEEAVRSGKTYTLRSPGLAFGGSLLVALAAAVIVLQVFTAPPDGSYVDSWEVACVFSNVMLALGVVIASSASMTVTPRQIRVANLFRKLSIPWESLTGAEAGLQYLHLETADRTVLVSAVEVAGYEGRVTRADRVAKVLQDELDRRTADRGEADTHALPVKRRWRLRPWLWLGLIVLDVILYVAIVLAH